MALFEEVEAWLDYLACADSFSQNYTSEVLNLTLDESQWVLICKQLEDIPVPNISYLLLYISLFVAGFLGNLVIIFHILYHGNIVRDLHSAYVLSLACSDLIYICLVPFLAIQMVTKSWIFGESLCRVFNSMDVCANHASVVAITLMCYDRMLAVTKPHSYSPRTKYETRLILTIAWISGGVVAIPNLVFSHVRSNGFLQNSLSCSAEFIQDSHSKAYITLLYIVDCGLPVLITTLMYSLTLAAIVKSHLQWNKKALDNIGHKKRPINLRLVFLVLSIIAAFWVCYIPFWTFNLVQSFIQVPNFSNFDIRGFFIILTYVNAALNPAFYSILPETRRKILLKTVLCRESSVEDHAYVFTDNKNDTMGQGGTSNSQVACKEKNPKGGKKKMRLSGDGEVEAAVHCPFIGDEERAETVFGREITTKREKNCLERGKSATGTLTTVDIEA